ncbi:MAG TPA: HlyD family efflux transporter periplasmic adaptor subunit [Actinomycetota bacterium]|jgi:multidrug efflux pump subunit AcrA (membrane-fusion protein)
MDSLWGEPEVTDVDQGRRPAGLKRVPGRARPPKRAPRRRPPPRGGGRIIRREEVWGAFAAVLLVLVGLGTVLNNAAETPTLPAGTGTATARVGTVKSVVHLGGVVVREAGQDQTSTVAGTVTTVWVRAGDQVSSGDDLVTITLPVVPAPPQPTPSGTFTPSPEPSPTPVTFVQKATLDGTVEAMRVAQGQEVAAGDTTMVIVPNRYDVVASVPPAQLSNFYTPPQQIEAQVPKGPEPFACTFVSIGGNLTSNQAQVVLGQEVDLRCSVPTTIPVFPGVRALVSVTTGEATDAVLVPVAAVRRVGDQGVVWVVTPGKAPVRRNVTLGLSDGHVIQISSGLAAGEVVLDPARPVAALVVVPSSAPPLTSTP